MPPSSMISSHNSPAILVAEGDHAVHDLGEVQRCVRAVDDLEQIARRARRATAARCPRAASPRRTSRQAEQRPVGEHRHRHVCELLDAGDHLTDAGVQGRFTRPGERDDVGLRRESGAHLGHDIRRVYPALPAHRLARGATELAVDAVVGARLEGHQIHAQGAPQPAGRHRPVDELPCACGSGHRLPQPSSAAAVLAALDSVAAPAVAASPATGVDQLCAGRSVRVSSGLDRGRERRCPR